MPTVDPWRTPVVIGNISEVASFILTICFLFSMYLSEAQYKQYYVNVLSNI